MALQSTLTIGKPKGINDLPTEVHIQIFIELGLGEFFDLTRTCTQFRSVFKDNAAAICNNVIRYRYSNLANALEAKLVDGWLVPSHKYVKDADANVVESQELDLCPYHEKGNLHLPCHGTFICSASQVAHIPLILLTNPGPHFLFFLSRPEGQQVEHTWNIWKAGTHYPPNGDIFACTVWHQAVVYLNRVNQARHAFKYPEGFLDDGDANTHVRTSTLGIFRGTFKAWKLIMWYYGPSGVGTQPIN